MDPRLEHRVDTTGYFSRAEAIDCGLTDKHLAAARRSGTIVRIRHGAYSLPRVLDALGPAGHHALLARVVADRMAGEVVISHSSAAALWGLELWGVPLDEVHVVRLAGRNGRHEAGVQHHTATLSPDDVVEVDGRLVVRPAVAAIQTATMATVESGMVTCTSALRTGGVTPDALRETAGRMDSWPRHRVADLAVRLSDARLESVGEVRSFHMFWRCGLPAPRLQVTLADADGIIGTVDDSWDDFAHVGEFDGMQKYGRLNPHVEDPGLVLTEEKVREDRIRALPRGMSRWTWRDLDAPERTCRRIGEAMEQSRRLYGTTARTVLV